MSNSVLKRDRDDLPTINSATQYIRTESGSDRVLAFNELDARVSLHQLSLGSGRYSILKGRPIGYNLELYEDLKLSRKENPMRTYYV
ncbi:MAG: hypothetical protein LC776_15720, partial [Acidobacteria bacterium]|nr:hypothetical protein [Acidobacteriota bacterium]